MSEPGPTAFLPPQPEPRRWRGGQPAGWWPRAGAVVLDGLLVGLPVGVAIALIAGEDASSLDGTSLRAITWLAGVVYATLMLTYRHGQTLGKQATAVRVLTEDGMSVRPGRSAARESVKALFGVTVVLYVIDVLWPLWHPENRALHDLIAGTRVVRA
jgi:uncharacterized RDD family membrane protein YckC